MIHAEPPTGLIWWAPLVTIAGAILVVYLIIILIKRLRK
jgi:hypothetical protein